ncbi:MAG: flavin reductase family protein [bacterium]
MKRISPSEIKDNSFNLIGKSWMLVSAGNLERINCMTASWGGFGVLWNKNVAFIFVRPVRYTYEFIERSEYFSLSFFDEKHRGILEYCGKVSGRNSDKVKVMSLHPEMHDGKSPLYEEARLSIICKKIYYSDLDPKHFLIDDIESNYPHSDYHRMYVGEITDVLVNDQKL